VCGVALREGDTILLIDKCDGTMHQMSNKAPGDLPEGAYISVDSGANNVKVLCIDIYNIFYVFLFDKKHVFYVFIYYFLFMFFYFWLLLVRFRFRCRLVARFRRTSTAGD
jgi:hypothetical protein